MPNNNKVAVIGLPGAWSSEILAQHLAEHSGACPVIPMHDVKVDLSNNSVLYGDDNLCEYDALVIKKVAKSYSPNALDRLSILSWLQSRGVKIFSPPDEIAKLINRLDCTLALNAAAIPMPPTCVTENIARAREFIIDQHSVVLKPLFSTKARGMEVVTRDDDISAALTRFQATNPLIYLQKKIAIPGKDLGLMFLGGEYRGCYARNAAAGSWNTTINDGGHYSEHNPRPTTIDIARRAQALYRLDFTTVDIVETDNDDETIVFEVSAFGGFKGAKEGLGIDIAKHYADYIIARL